MKKKNINKNEEKNKGKNEKRFSLPFKSIGK